MIRPKKQYPVYTGTQKDRNKSIRFLTFALHRQTLPKKGHVKPTASAFSADNEVKLNSNGEESLNEMQNALALCVRYVLVNFKSLHDVEFERKGFERRWF